MFDPWRLLRNKCFGNEEVALELIAVTEPQGDDYSEMLPAISAAVSYGSGIRSLGDAKKLNHKLIHHGHLTPLESVQFNFHISGISKICGAQLSRHRIGQGHVSASRRFRQQEMSFVYPMLDYIKDEREVARIYSAMSASNQRCFEQYLILKGNNSSLKKSDARYMIPASTASERHWWVNARALRDFFRLRLASDAEWEIKRLAVAILSIVKAVTPSLFEDFTVTE